MSQQPENEFHDPSLKQAICRCWAKECASSALRRRVSELLVDPKLAPVPSRRRLGPFAWMIWPAAAAALVLISVGIFNHFHPGSAYTVVALPVGLENDLIRTHDHCRGMANHQGLSVSKGDDAAIVDALHAKLNRPVIMFHPADSAWVFRGASVCPVGSASSGHLVFVKGTSALSIFSLPKSSMPDAAEGAQYSATVGEHCIVGFVRDGALFCMVSSGPPQALGIEEMKKMESQMQPAVAAIPPPEPEKIILTELLQPVR